MTPRSVLGSLLALCVFALSCQVLPRLADSRALPPVGSAPRASLEPAPPPEVAAPDAPLDEAEEIRLVRSQLEGQHTGLSPREVGNLARTIVVESRRYGLETQLVLAVMKVESSFYHRAVSPVGAMGLMQILPSTGKEMAHALDIPWRGAHTLFDAQVNVAGMMVKPGDIIHADQHGAVVIPDAVVAEVPAAADLLARREAVVLEVARAPGFNMDLLRKAWADQADIH